MRGLFQEYRRWLAKHCADVGIDESVVNRGREYIDQEIDSLPGEYGPPAGALVLARDGTTPVGCGAVRQFQASIGEIKRVFVRPSHRGRSLGRRITEEALNEARKLGYHRVFLDTMPTMTAAIALYRKMGFVPIPPYWANPIRDALYFEYALTEPPKHARIRLD